jgi:hypothetical protein
MKKNQEIWKETNAVSPLVASISSENPYEIPVDYFNDLAGSCLIKTGRSKLSALSENDFEDFSSETSTKHHEENETDFSLEKSNANPYQMPADYFSNFEKELHQKIAAEKRGGLVVSIKNWKTWAAAACIVGILGLAIYTTSNKPSNNEWSYALEDAKNLMLKGNLEEEFKTINPEVLANFLTEQGHDVDAAVVACASEESAAEPLDLLNMDNQTVEDFLMNEAGTF